MLSFIKQKVGRKIAIGYLITCSLLLGVGLFAMTALTQVTAQVGELTQQLSLEMELIKDIAAKTDLARLYANSFIMTQSQEALNRFDSNFKELQVLLKQAASHSNNPNRRNYLKTIEEAAEKYGRAFQEVTGLIRKKQDTLLGPLKINTFLVENKLSAIRVDVDSGSAPRIFLSFGNAQNAFLLMRLHTSEYLKSGDERYAVLHRKASEQALAAFGSLEQAFSAPLDKKRAQEARQGIEAYAEGFALIREINKDVRRIRSKTFAVLEPVISRHVEKVVESLEAQQARHNESAQKLLAETNIQLTASMIVAVLISLLLGLFISRRITSPLRRVMHVSEVIANTDLKRLTELLDALAHGDQRSGLEVTAEPLKIEQKDEVGQTAKAFDQIIFRLLEAERAFKAMSSYLMLMTDAAQSVAAGDLDLEIRVHSEQDRLGQAVAAMVAHLRRAETEVRNYQNHLRDLVDERTAQLEESRRYLATLLSNLPGMAYRAGAEGHRSLEFASGGALELTGYPPSRLTDPQRVCYADLIHPDDYPRTREEIQKALAENRPYTLLYRILSADGELKWVWEKGQPVASANMDHPAVIEGFITDITERTRAEQAMKASELLLRQIIDLVPHFIFAKNKAGEFVLVNRAVAQAYGTTVEELTGKCDGDFTQSDEEAEHFREDDLKVIETGRPQYIPEETITGADGELRYLQTTKIPFVVSGTEYPAVLGVSIDITERKLAEEEKNRLKDQLLHSQKLEAVGILAGGVAHDFNNLLQAINGYTQLLLMGKDESETDHQNLMAIQQSCERAAKLVRQLLLFSRKAETEHQPLNLNQEVEQARKLLERTIPKMIAIELRLDPDLWTLNADPVQIEQILLNLGTNAVDAMPDGGEIVIETRNAVLEQENLMGQIQTEPGPYVQLTISDTGQGMDQETIEHIFEPFYTTKGIGKGTGLGLASVYGIVKSHGGYISCHSRPGQGSTFYIYFPAVDRGKITETQKMEAKPMKGGHETILLVDDEEAIRKIAAESLQFFGYSILTASSGEAALESYRNQPSEIDLVIMDLGMPGMGGHKCMIKIKELDPEAKILITSGYFFEGKAGDVLGSGAAGFMGKPYQLSDLLNKVREILDAS